MQSDADFISQAIRERFDPVPQFDLSVESQDGRDVLAVTVAEGDSPPYYYRADGRMETFVRVGNSSVSAESEQLLGLMLKGTHQTWDALDSGIGAERASFSVLRATYANRMNDRLDGLHQHRAVGEVAHHGARADSDRRVLREACQHRFVIPVLSACLGHRIGKMASAEERKALNKQVHVHGRPKRQDQSDFVAVDQLQDAMARRSKVLFRYYKYGAGKERVARRGGAARVVTPVNLTYSDGNYYLVAYSAADGEIRNYRVDRMGQIAVTGESVDRNETIACYDPDEAARTAFGMYDGERVVMTLKVDADLMNVVVDRFGRDVDAVPSDDGRTATVTVPVRESLVFYGWLATVGDGA